LKQKWIPLFLVVTLLCSSCALIPVEEELPVAPILRVEEGEELKTVAVERGTLTEEQMVICKYKADFEENLAFTQDGLAISAVYVQAGDTVEAGDLIAELDNTQLLEDIAAQSRTVRSLGLQYSRERQYIETQEARIDVLEQLAATDSSYQSQLASAKRSLESRSENRDHLASQLYVEDNYLKKLEDELASRRLYASMSGTVSYVVSVGEKTVFCKANSTICTIRDLSSGTFTGKYDTEYFKVGDKVTIACGDENYTATVSTVTVTDSRSSPYHVSFTPDFSDPSLRIGSTGKITLVLQQLEDVLYLPYDVIYTQGDSHYVYYSDENGVTAVKKVEVGTKIDGMVEITGGLEEGELVIS